jgi:hypothetical protein
LNELDIVRTFAGAVPYHDPDAGVLLDMHIFEGERFIERVEEPFGNLFGLVRRGKPLGQVQKFVAAETANGVRRAGHVLKAVSNRDE